MTDESLPDEVYAFALAHIHGARQALRGGDIETLIGCLAAAIALYEEHPSYVQDSGVVAGLLMFIRSARSICQTSRRPENDLRRLESRAEALRASHLH